MGSEVDRLERCLSRAEGKIEALELDAERCHHQLDEYGVPRQSPADSRLELSLCGRLELFLEDLERSRSHNEDSSEE